MNTALFSSVRSRTRSLVLLVGIVAACVPVASFAQHSHEDTDHDHGTLHFSHPILTESPSPDTKLRFDVGSTLTGSPRDNAATIEGEYAFSPMVSLSVVGTHAWQSGDATDLERSNAIELAIKGASFAIAQRGMLFGGGLGLEIPLNAGRSGAGEKEPASLEPFADWALEKGALQIVTMAAYSTTIRETDREQRFRLSGSALIAATKAVEILGEIEFADAISKEEAATVRLAPGIKVRPWDERELSLGVSVPFGIANSRSRSMLVSMFYHF
jgi:hypothetical protein